VSSRQESSRQPQPNEAAEVEVEGEMSDQPGESKLFACLNEGCVKSYQRYANLEKHLSFGKCRLMPEKQTLLDRAKIGYHELLHEGGHVPSSQATTTESGEISAFLEGWALKKVKKEVTIPVSIKLGPFFTNLCTIINRLVDNGADGLLCAC